MNDKPDSPSSNPPDQLRKPIQRGEGVTETERQLVKLAEQSFLNLWSYPNIYRDQKVGGAGDGKELCDLLVVCGQHVLIFSEKNIAWTDAETRIAWRRWFKRAVKNSADQLDGAERWIREHPDRLFLDKDCSQPFPIDLPAPDHRIIHKIVVARGAGKACIDYFSGGLGSLVIDPSVIGSAHFNANDAELKPFHVGDLNSGDDYVHVFDDATLSIVLNELDTITDFTEYLTKKSAFIRSGRLVAASGEEDLLAYYISRTDEFGEHEFTAPDGGQWDTNERIAIDGSHFGSLISNPQYLAKKLAEQNSYIWDMLIKNFTDHMLDGTSIVLDGSEYNLRANEKAVRIMALENRFSRRIFGDAISDAMDLSLNVDRFFRIMMNSTPKSPAETGYFFFTLKYLKWMEQYGYLHYRQKRQEFLTAYAKGILVRYPALKRVIGIAVEPPRESGGGSEDLILVEQFPWSDDDVRSINEQCERLDILKDGYVENRHEIQEFPELIKRSPKIPPPTKKHFSRRQRMAAAKRSKPKA